jgi:hypothetical protein
LNMRDLKRGSRRVTTEHADNRLGDACARKVVDLTVHKVTWTQVGMVTEPGRYMFRFGWLAAKHSSPNPPEIKCPECDGTGLAPVKQPVQPGRKIYPAPCKKCGGKGRIAVN